MPPSLLEAHNALAARCNGYRVFERHFVPDRMLHGFALEVIEQTHAILLLTEPDSLVPRAAIANARSAFEAAWEMLLLVSGEASFDRYGALVRAFELLEQEKLLERRDRASAAIQLDVTDAGMTPEQAAEKDGQVWGVGFPTAPELMRQAVAELREKPRRHWLGVSQTDMGFAIRKRYGSEDPGLGEMVDTTYGVLSVHAHARPRTNDRGTRIEDGRVVFTSKEEHGRLASSVGAVACQLAENALKRRANFEN
jgi:hypothetical protein